jgi:hypothetical protein
VAVAELVLEEFPVPRAVRVNDRPKIHLAEPELGASQSLCGQEGTLTAVELTMEEIDELPQVEKCQKCPAAANGRARIRRLTR